MKSHPSTIFHTDSDEWKTKGIDILKEEIPALNEGTHAYETVEISEDALC